jgi:tetratricopeptide (TPR) repeat protein
MLRTLLSGLRPRDRTGTTADAVQRAFAAREAGDLESARALLTGAIERQPGHFDALCLLADIELARGAPAAALTLAREAVTVEPEHPDGFELLGAALAKTGERDAAAEAFLQAIALDPADRPRTRNELAVLLIGLNRAGQAASMLRWVLKRDPEFAEAHVNLGVALKMLSAGE